MADGLPNDSQEMAVALVGAGAEVLELGCGEGHVSSRLTANGCRVTGIELDPRAAETATDHLAEVHVVDLDSVRPSAVLQGRRFERIVVGDVFEHLVDPVTTLADLSELLTDDGLLISSIPNVTHADVRLMLLGGAWRYQDVGLLDRTHLRFFDLAGVLELFAMAGWRIERLERTTKDPLRSELADLALEAARAPGVLDAVLADPEATTYQFVVVAAPGEPVSDATEQFAHELPDRRPHDGAAGIAGDDADRLLAENQQLRVKVRDLEERLEDALWTGAIWKRRLTGGARRIRAAARATRRRAPGGTLAGNDEPNS